MKSMDKQSLERIIDRLILAVGLEESDPFLNNERIKCFRNQILAHFPEQTIAERDIGIKIGKQLTEKAMCPECKEIMGTDQPLYTVGDVEYMLFCPHCDLTVNLVVKR